MGPAAVKVNVKNAVQFQTSTQRAQIVPRQCMGGTNVSEAERHMFHYSTNFVCLFLACLIPAELGKLGALRGLSLRRIS